MTANGALAGFTTLGGPHLMMLGVCLLAGIFLILMAGRSAERPEGARSFIRACAILQILLEAAQDIYMVAAGESLLYYLPLHLCSLGIFINLYGAFSDSRPAAALREVSLVLIAPGSLFAMLFPDWTYMPLLSLPSVIGFAGHTLLIAIPLMMLKSGMITPHPKHIWYTPVFLVLVSIPVYLFDVKFHCNYMFLRSPVDGTPLAWWAERLGEPGYLLGILLMIILILTLEYAGIAVYRRLKTKEDGQKDLIE